MKEGRTKILWSRLTISPLHHIYGIYGAAANYGSGSSPSVLTAAPLDACHAETYRRPIALWLREKSEALSLGGGKSLYVTSAS
jgi:hypothetical protein